MTIDQVNSILNKYGIAIHSDDELQLINQITMLTTSDINNLFNDLIIEQVFEKKERNLLF